jgi:lipid A 3-O-deacylase
LREKIGWKIIFFALLVICSRAALGQKGPEPGGNEIQVWAAGGYSVPGGTSNTGVFNAGLRYGWNLTAPHGPGFLRGSFEYAVDTVPVFMIFEPANTTYGFAINPLGLKWNFVRHGRIVPYFELGGGVLFTGNEVPTGTSNVNFTPSAALGFHYLGNRLTWSMDVRYLHISDAGLSRFNPGINSVQVRLGIGVFRHKH